MTSPIAGKASFDSQYSWYSTVNVKRDKFGHDARGPRDHVIRYDVPINGGSRHTFELRVTARFMRNSISITNMVLSGSYTELNVVKGIL
jgi:hypothetical protein